MTRAAANTLAAADALLDWLHRQSSPAVRRPGPLSPPPTDPHDLATATPAGSERSPAADAEVAIADLAPAAAVAEAVATTDRPAWGGAASRSRETGDSLQAAWDQAAPLRLAHTDWLHHRLTITGPPAAVAALEKTAVGAGVIPWQLDLDRLAEDLFHVLVAPPPPHRRSLSAGGARILADQLLAAVARRRTAVASTLVAGLELARTGTVALEQDGAWTAIRVGRRHDHRDAATAVPGPAA